MSKRQVTEEAILELHGKKSNLLLEAQMLIGIGNPEEAMERYAQAAPMEVQIARFYARCKEKDMAAKHRFSAGVCYAKSGSLRNALQIFDALGRDNEIPGQYKIDALLWASHLRQQRREALKVYETPLQSVA
jgi:hypothetical protein